MTKLLSEMDLRPPSQAQNPFVVRQLRERGERELAKVDWGDPRPIILVWARSGRQHTERAVPIERRETGADFRVANDIKLGLHVNHIVEVR